MLGLNGRAVLYRCTGQRGGRPEYDPAGVAFPCRVEPVDSGSAGNRGRDHEAQARLYAPSMAVKAGDRIVLPDGGALIASEVRTSMGLTGAHHVEIVARSEG